MSDPVNGPGAADAASSLEAYFLRRILAEVKTGSSINGGGFGGEMLQEMFHETLADKMADAGGLGLAPMLESQLAAADGMETPRPASGIQPVVNPAEAGRRYGLKP